MPTRAQTSAEYFKGIFMLYTTLLIGQIVILSILFYIRNYSGNSSDIAQSQNIFVIMALCACVASILISFFLSKVQMGKILASTELREKLSLYRVSLLMRFVILEGATIISIIFYFIDGNSTLLMLSLIMIVVFLVNKPSREKIIESLDLTMGQRMKLENPEEMVAEIQTQY